MKLGSACEACGCRVCGSLHGKARVLVNVLSCPAGYGPSGVVRHKVYSRVQGGVLEAMTVREAEREQQDQKAIK